MCGRNTVLLPGLRTIPHTAFPQNPHTPHYLSPLCLSPHCLFPLCPFKGSLILLVFTVNDNFSESEIKSWENAGSHVFSEVGYPFHFTSCRITHHTPNQLGSIHIGFWH